MENHIEHAFPKQSAFLGTLAMRWKLMEYLHFLLRQKLCLLFLYKVGKAELYAVY